MSNRNFDSRVIIQRLESKNYSHNLYKSQVIGQRIVSNPQNSNSNSSQFSQYISGSQTVYQRGLLGNGICINTGGTCNV